MAKKDKADTAKTEKTEKTAPEGEVIERKGLSGAALGAIVAAVVVTAIALAFGLFLLLDSSRDAEDESSSAVSQTSSRPPRAPVVSETSYSLYGLEDISVPEQESARYARLIERDELLASPDDEAEVIGRVVDYLMVIAVGEPEDGWQRIIARLNGDRYVDGYVHEEHVEKLYLGITNDELTVRAGPDGIYTVIGSVPKDTRILVIGEEDENGWIRVEFSNSFGTTIDGYGIASDLDKICEIMAVRPWEGFIDMNMVIHDYIIVIPPESK